jgi:hypothetical protein
MCSPLIGWSIGTVQDRYITTGAGADQKVGRAVCGLPSTEISFATLPPHFYPETSEVLQTIGWNNFLSGKQTTVT